MSFIVHLDASYWLVDDERRLIVQDSDGPLRAYQELQARPGEPFVIVWPDGPHGLVRSTRGGLVRWIAEDHEMVERLIEDRLQAEQRRRG
jgi:hypothetical protein